MQATENPTPPTAPALIAWLRLERTEGVGLLSAHRLLDKLGSPQAIFDASRQQLLALVKPDQADALLRPQSRPRRTP